MLRRILKRAMRKWAPRVPNASPTERKPPTTRADWQGEQASPTPAPPDPEPPAPEVEVEAAEVASWVEAGQDILLVDIREPHEVRQGFAEGALLIPMNDVPHSLAALPRDRSLVVYCAAGVRSYGVTHWLRENGYSESWSLVGGLGAWLETGASWRSPTRNSELAPLQSVAVGEGAPDTLPPAGTEGRVQDIRDDVVDVLFHLPDGTMTRCNDISPQHLERPARRR